ncbi:hypothetical protein VNO80_26365 [Phaseolus coccineus]|uniref:Uncharacterized protein n=1 Tax=Phaseolus coccineus TaxID=3886 RepID=A0AAN9LEM1_PHACN
MGVRGRVGQGAAWKGEWTRELGLLVGSRGLWEWSWSSGVGARGRRGWRRRGGEVEEELRMLENEKSFFGWPSFSSTITVERLFSTATEFAVDTAPPSNTDSDGMSLLPLHSRTRLLVIPAFVG